MTETLKSDPAALANALWDATMVLDALGLYTTEVFQQAREQLIARQQEELIELSTPVVHVDLDRDQQTVADLQDGDLGHTLFRRQRG